MTQLVEMGFDAASVTAALRACGGDAQMALESLLSGV